MCDLSVNASLSAKAQRLKYHAESAQGLQKDIEYTIFWHYNDVEEENLLLRQWNTLAQCLRLIFRHEGGNFSNKELHQHKKLNFKDGRGYAIPDLHLSRDDMHNYRKCRKLVNEYCGDSDDENDDDELSEDDS